MGRPQGGPGVWWGSLTTGWGYLPGLRGVRPESSGCAPGLAEVPEGAPWSLGVPMGWDPRRIPPGGARGNLGAPQGTSGAPLDTLGYPLDNPGVSLGCFRGFPRVGALGEYPGGAQGVSPRVPLR